jgi:hypothetical protein
MPGDPPTDEYFRVRDQLREIFEDYVFLFAMRGVQYDVDVYRDGAELDRRANQALEDAKYLDGLLRHLHTLATTNPAALHQEWPEVLDILRRYTYHHELLQGVRPLAKVWGVDLDEAVARAIPGRPRATSPIAGDRGELWQVGNQVLARFQGEDPGQRPFARAYLRQKGIRPRVGTDHANPSRSLLRRAQSLGINGGHEGLIRFLRGPQPES